jgi:CRP-like cAMP-binding protein
MGKGIFAEVASADAADHIVKVLGANGLSKLATSREPRVLADNELLWEPGDRPTTVAVVAAGMIRLSRPTPVAPTRDSYPQEVALRSYGVGNCLGLAAVVGERHTTEARALGEAAVIELDPEKFRGRLGSRKTDELRLACIRYHRSVLQRVTLQYVFGVRDGTRRASVWTQLVLPGRFDGLKFNTKKELAKEFGLEPPSYRKVVDDLVELGLASEKKRAPHSLRPTSLGQHLHRSVGLDLAYDLLGAAMAGEPQDEVVQRIGRQVLHAFEEHAPSPIARLCKKLERALDSERSDEAIATLKQLPNAIDRLEKS